jgi:protein arginine N-methyltransferase 2
MLLTLLAQKNESEQSPSTLILKSVEATAAGNTDAFLSSKLRFEKDTHGQDVCLVDAGDEEVGVMMGWEREISALPSSLPLC